MSEWISVEERVPEQPDYDGISSINVLIATDSNEIAIGFRDLDDGAWFNFLGHELDVEVTHWMPIPAPPSE